MRGPLRGCDTFVALPDSTNEGVIIFGKNSDRPKGESQSIKRYPAKSYNDSDKVQCTYISIPQAAHTYAVILSQIDWMFGVEMGANEKGVVIGNEAVWTTEPCGKESLIGMDLVRLGLERSDTARGAIDIITELLKKYGQGGACAEVYVNATINVEFTNNGNYRYNENLSFYNLRRNYYKQGDSSFTYHNSFLIADREEAWILETADFLWVAKCFKGGVHNISNNLTIRKDYDLCCEQLSGEKIDFAEIYSLGGANGIGEGDDSRQGCGMRLLQEKVKNSNGKGMTAQDMKDILRDHDSGICMHGGFETTSAQISVLKPNGEDEHLFIQKPHPCKMKFEVVTWMT